MRTTYSATTEAALVDAVQTFNNDWAAAIQSIHSLYPSEVIYGLDVYTPFNEMLHGTFPGYTFTNVTDAASSVMPVPPSADAYLFWDQIHPTEIAHKLLGDAAYTLVASSPSVSSFSVTPTTLTQGASVQVRWAVSDPNGSGLRRVELWRAPDVSGTPGNWGSSPIQTQTVSGIAQVNGAFADIPPGGKWWYSIHVVDVNGVTSTEHDAGLGPTSVTVQRVSRWSGGGANANWSTAANWGGTAMAANDYVEFGAAAGVSTNNDLAAGTQFGNFTFDAGAGAFTLNGNTVNLAGDVTNNSANKETINLPLALTGNPALECRRRRLDRRRQHRTNGRFLRHHQDRIGNRDTFGRQYVYGRHAGLGWNRRCNQPERLAARLASDGRCRRRFRVRGAGDSLEFGRRCRRFAQSCDWRRFRKGIRRETSLARPFDSGCVR